jgi:hypothetical protein
MKEWSIKQPFDTWRIKIYLDTNILIFLSDNSYTGLKDTLNYLLSKNTFVDLISSQYALFEYLENRKKIHYKSHLKNNGIADTNRPFNFLNRILTHFNLQISYSKKFKWKDYYSFNIKGFSYINIHKKVSNDVDMEISNLCNNFTIEYKENVFNQNLFEPTKKLCLSSRISRQDCLITTSAIHASETSQIRNIIIWTGDEDFYKAFNECESTKLIFPDLNPKIEWICNLTYQGNNGKFHSMNLEVETRTEKIDQFLRNMVKEYILLKNKSLFLGKTKVASNAENVFYFQTEPGVSIPFRKDGYYFTIIGKDLDFIVSSKLVHSLWLDKELKETDFPIYTSSILSGKWEFADSTEEGYKKEIIQTLKGADHMIFLSE